MRIDRLQLKNFRKFSELSLDLHPQFTLLVGVNGAGKTSLLDALALGALSPFLAHLQIPDIYYPTIEPKHVRSTPVKVADRLQFSQYLPVNIQITGQIGRMNGVHWGQLFKAKHHWSVAEHVKKVMLELYDGDPLGKAVNCPVLAFYGVTRAALPERQSNPMPLTPARRWDAYRHWFNERIAYDDLRYWFLREAAAGINGGHKRPGYEVVRRAIFGCVPGADDLWFDVDRADLVCSIDGQAQPLSNLSDGQRMLLAMVADIAIKAVTVNAHLLPHDKLGPEDELLPQVLQKTPGVVLIDELDVHLHPSWQRRVAADLKRTFPSIQFVCTSHSPQVIGEIPPEQIRIIDGEVVYSPEHSFGVDSSRILEEIMDTKPRTEFVDQLLSRLSRQISDDDFDGARATLQKAETILGANDPEITSARALIDFVEQPA